MKNIFWNHKISKTVAMVYIKISLIQIGAKILLSMIAVKIVNEIQRNFPFLTSKFSHSGESVNLFVAHPFLVSGIIAFFLAKLAESIFNNNYGEKTNSYKVLLIIANIILITVGLTVFYNRLYIPFCYI